MPGWHRGCDFAAEDAGVADYRSSGALLEIAILQHLKLTFGRDNTAVRGTCMKAASLGGSANQPKAVLAAFREPARMRGQGHILDISYPRFW
jgi:hypothetical protein